MVVLAAISKLALWVNVGVFALCGVIIAGVAWSMRNPKLKK